MLLCVCCHRRDQELAEPVEVSDGMQMKLDPVAACRIVPDGRIVAEARADPRPARPRDPHIDHARRLQMGYLTVAANSAGLSP